MIAIIPGMQLNNTREINSTKAIIMIFVDDTHIAKETERESSRKRPKSESKKLRT